MSQTVAFKQYIEEGYQCKGDYIVMGTAMLDGEAVNETLVKVPLKSLNRHGLIAGATGTGKTKSLQLLSESLSDKGVPVLLMDLKGDLSGLAQPGKDHPKIQERHEKIGLPYEPSGYPIEFLSLSDEKGARLRATVSEFGPILFSKILNLNDTQTGVVSVIFKYCDDNNLPLLDLKDFREALNYCATTVKDDIASTYGTIATASVGAILRKLVELEQQGAERFFGEESFEVDDLLRRDREGRGYLSIIRLTDIQDRPKLFSTFMLCLLAEIYAKFPEQGDADKPKLVIFIDEAHLIFDKASDALVDQIESIVKLIRSKGVGLFFVTQNPADVPDAVLSQLGMKVQHALRAFTAKDRKAIKLAAQNYPITDWYDTAEVITSLGIGEALVTALDEKGRPTPLASTLLRAPRSRMDVLTDAEIDEVVGDSKLVPIYNKEIDRESAYEILRAKIQEMEQAQYEEQAYDGKEENRKPASSKKKTAAKEEPGWLDSLSKNTMVRQLGRTAMREVTRSLLGVLGVRNTRRRTTRRGGGWF